jgi:hypothetical protein
MKELERKIKNIILEETEGNIHNSVSRILSLITERDGRILENTIKCIEENSDKFNRSGALGNIDLITQIFDDLEREEK